MCDSPDIDDALLGDSRGLHLRYVCSVDQCFNVIKSDSGMPTGLGMSECLTSRVVVSGVEFEGYSHCGRGVRSYHQCMTCTDGNCRIKFPDELHKITVRKRNPPLLFEPFQSAHCCYLFSETIVVLLAWRPPMISSSPSLWSISSSA